MRGPCAHGLRGGPSRHDRASTRCGLVSPAFGAREIQVGMQFTL